MRRRGRRSTAREARALFPLLSSIQYYHTRSDSKHAIAATGTYIYLEHRPQPVVAPSLVAPEVVVQPPLLLRGISVVQVDVVVVVLVATGLVLKLYEAFNGVGGDIADQIHGDVTPDS